MEYDSVEFKGSLTDVCLTDWLYDWREDHISMRLTYYTSDCLTVCMTNSPAVCVTDCTYVLLMDRISQWLTDWTTNSWTDCMCVWFNDWLYDWLYVCTTDGTYVRLTKCMYVWLTSRSYHIFHIISDIYINENHFINKSICSYHTIQLCWSLQMLEVVININGWWDRNKVIYWYRDFD